MLNNTVTLTAGVRVAVATWECNEFGSGRLEATSTCDRDLRALGVELLKKEPFRIFERNSRRKAAYRGKRVKRNGLETDEIVAARHSLRNGRGPGRVLGNHDTVTPDTVVDGAVDETRLVDLELSTSDTIRYDMSKL